MDSLLERLKPDERAGSKPRCHWLTHGSPVHVASRLNVLAEPWASVSSDDCWMPEGFCRTQEAELDKAIRLLPRQGERDKLRSWWLVVSSRNTRTPNWDIASTCTIDGRKGLILVEAKAHDTELYNETGGKSLDVSATANSRRNHAKIGKAIDEANVGLADQTGRRWSLSRDNRYQMSNRFAWSWKIAELGYPVVLIYLGFLEAEEM